MESKPSFKKVIGIILKYFKHLYAQFCLIFKGKSFVILINLFCICAGTKARFQFDKKSRRYSYYDRGAGCTIAFTHRSRAIKYHRGIAYRARTLAKDYMIAQLDFQAGDTVIDCGANIGELWYWFRFNDKPVRYVAFEPSPAEFSALQQNVPDGELFNMGLWNEDGELTFYVSSEEADSSLIEPSDYSEVIRVRTARLDQFIDRKIKLLKLEAEGAEPEILAGAGDKLGLIEYISADLGFERGKDHENTLVPVVNYLTARGFELVDIYAPRFTALFRNTAFAGEDATYP